MAQDDKTRDVREASYRKETTGREHEKNRDHIQGHHRSLTGAPVDPNSPTTKINIPPGIEPEDVADPGRATPGAPPVDNRSGAPDPNAGAPRPSHADRAPGVPDIDNPPGGTRGGQPLFDKAVSAADEDARKGQRPGQGDYAATRAEGTAQAPERERERHQEPPDKRRP